MTFAVDDGTFGGLETVRVADPDGGAVAEIALRGATLLRWVPRDGLPDVVDGYRDEAELRSQDGVRNGLMAPFSNRVRAGRYTFDGTEHDLLPGVPEGERLFHHGFLRLVDCDPVSGATGDGQATLRFATTAVRPRLPVRRRPRGRVHDHARRAGGAAHGDERRRAPRALRQRLAPLPPPRRGPGGPAGAARAGPDDDPHRRGADPARRCPGRGGALRTDAVNRPDHRDAVVLAPGAHRGFRFGVEVSPAG